jgi:hypothetical protein
MLAIQQMHPGPEAKQREEWVVRLLLAEVSTSVLAVAEEEHRNH